MIKGIMCYKTSDVPRYFFFHKIYNSSNEKYVTWDWIDSMNEDKEYDFATEDEIYEYTSNGGDDWWLSFAECFREYVDDPNMW